jgi:hypothetical protein
MTKTFLTSIAALLLATGTAHATSYSLHQCGSKLIYVYGHHGYTYYLLKNVHPPKTAFDANIDRELPKKMFVNTAALSGLFGYRPDNYDSLSFHGRKCREIEIDNVEWETGVPLPKPNPRPAEAPPPCTGKYDACMKYYQ